MHTYLLRGPGPGWGPGPGLLPPLPVLRPWELLTICLSDLVPSIRITNACERYQIFHSSDKYNFWLVDHWRAEPHVSLIYQGIVQVPHAYCERMLDTADRKRHPRCRGADQTPWCEFELQFSGPCPGHFANILPPNTMGCYYQLYFPGIVGE